MTVRLMHEVELHVASLMGASFIEQLLQEILDLVGMRVAVCFQL
jgi:hypothetical protein